VRVQAARIPLDEALRQPGRACSLAAVAQRERPQDRILGVGVLAAGKQLLELSNCGRGPAAITRPSGAAIVSSGSPQCCSAGSHSPRPRSCSGAPVSTTGARGSISRRGTLPAAGERHAAQANRALATGPRPRRARQGGAGRAAPRAQMPHHGWGNAARHANDRVRRGRRADRPRREPGPRAEPPTARRACLHGFSVPILPGPRFRTNSLPTPASPNR
jgi:hypothetical protein